MLQGSARLKHQQKPQSPDDPAKVGMEIRELGRRLLQEFIDSSLFKNIHIQGASRAV